MEREYSMIDKIVMYSRDFQPSKEARLTVEPLAIDYVTHSPVSSTLLWMDGSEPVEGKVAYNNDSDIYTTIKHGKLKITFNPSTIINGNNFFPVTPEELVQSLDIVSEHLSGIGIGVNTDYAKIERIDLCRNIETDHHFSCYKPALDFISPKYLRGVDPTILGDYWLKKNRTRQYCFYDKLGELLSRKIDPLTLGVQSQNVMRGEIRFMNHKGTETALHLHTAGELRNREYYFHLADTYKSILTKDVFRIQDCEHTIGLFDSLTEELSAMHEDGICNAPIKLMAKYAIEDRGGTEWFVKLMLNAGYDRTHAWRKRKEMEDLIRTRTLREQSTIPFQILLDEMYNKFVA
ncbi:MAG: hypothetical protein HOD37_04180 [Bacteroidetes bacterium]|jgi:hypothetical protein|nr:hypothetical protein [Bacteroidota bacterium]